jgi:hypothetical protein
MFGSNGHIDFYSRESFGGNKAASLDSITVYGSANVPEQTYTAIFGLAVLGFAACRPRQKSS